MQWITHTHTHKTRHERGQGLVERRGSLSGEGMREDDEEGMRERMTEGNGEEVMIIVNLIFMYEIVKE